MAPEPPPWAASLRVPRPAALLGPGAAHGNAGAQAGGAASGAAGARLSSAAAGGAAGAGSGGAAHAGPVAAGTGRRRRRRRAGRPAVIKDPHADPAFQAMKGKSTAAAGGAKTHAPAKAGAAGAQAAAVPPSQRS